MKAEHQYLCVPQHVPNDETAMVVEWQIADGEWVEAGQTVCVLEFSKATFDLPAERAGYLFQLRKAGEEVGVGLSLGVISAVREKPPAQPESPNPAPATAGGTPTRKASELMKAHDLTVGDFPGVEIIREHQVLALIEERTSRKAGSSPGVPWVALPHTPRQRRLVRTITESHRTIPHSWLTLAVDGRALRQRLDEARARTESMISLTDLLVYAVSRAASACPGMNACFAEGETRVFQRVNVGIAMNMDNSDLLVPVIPEAGSLSLVQIAGRCRQLQKKALRNSLTAEELTGGTVTVTSLVGTGVSQICPLIVPQQSFIAAIGDSVGVGETAIHFLTAAFDHRVMNGSEAARCLATIEKALRGEPDGSVD